MGIVWSTTTYPTIEQHTGITIEGSDIGIFTSLLTDLQPNTNYYVRAYVVNGVGTTYGNEVQFITDVLTGLPSVTTLNVNNITQTTASGGGNVTSNGGSTVIAKGICWSTNTTPTIADDTTNDGTDTGNFISHLTGLQANTIYFLRAYATNTIGTGYGDQLQFTTPPTVVFPVYDYDGNLYDTVHIGTQIWLKSNLKTTHYNDGAPIPNDTSQTTWVSLSSGALCF